MAKLKRDPLSRDRNETALQYASRLAYLKQGERDRTEPVVSIHAMQHGQFVSDGKAKRNVKTTTFTKWLAAKQLTDTQQAAIYYCMRLWEAMPPAASTTSQYGERLGSGSPSFETDGAITRYLDAKDDVARICGGVRKGSEYQHGYVLRGDWNVFENILRYDMVQDEVILLAGFSARSGPARCLQIVCSVADIIARNERLSADMGIRVSNG